VTVRQLLQHACGAGSLIHRNLHAVSISLTGN